MEKITAWKCDFCKDSSRSIYLSRSGCSKHEKKCWLNPARKSCATCSNLSEYIEDREPFGGSWKCSERKEVMPFAQKISDCLYWEESGAIFANIGIKFDRPIERKVYA